MKIYIIPIISILLILNLLSCKVSISKKENKDYTKIAYKEDTSSSDLRIVTKEELKQLNGGEDITLGSEVIFKDENNQVIDIMTYARKMKVSNYKNVFHIDAQNNIKLIEMHKVEGGDENKEPEAIKMIDVNCDNKKDLLEEMLVSDQKVREGEDDYFAVDNKNQQLLISIINKCGWPTKKEVGEDAMLAVFLVLQHAPLELQEEYFPNIKEACQKGDLEIELCAYMEDRILMRYGKMQKFGTQTINIGGNTLIWPIDNYENIDRRRSEYNLGSYSEFLKKTNLEYPRDIYKMND